MTVLRGAPVAAAIRTRLAQEVEKLKAKGVVPRLDAILVGENPASRVYVRAKARACEELGIRSQTHFLPANVSAHELAAVIEAANADPQVDGILLQLPLPTPLESHRFLSLIRPDKDVDGFHPENVGLLWQGRSRFVPCTPAGILELLRFYGIPLASRNAVVIGRSDIVGKPMAALLLQENATVTVAHSRTQDLAAVCREAEILVVAVGKPALVGPEYVREGAVVVDVGVNRVENPDLVARLFPNDPQRLEEVNRKGYTLVGDVDYVAVSSVVAAITPVPGGVGPLTISQLLANTVKACGLRRG